MPGTSSPIARPAPEDDSTAVAVVGAGPAGSTAARLLAARGAEVILFEARPLPRAKICGGGLTPKAQRLVPDSALRVVERHVERVELRGPHVQPIQFFGCPAQHPGA